MSSRERPLAIDLFCGLGGWTEGLLAEGYDVVGFDIEQHVYGEHRYPAQLVIQDVLTLHGSQFKDAALLVMSPPCQEFSYMAMPWKRGKQIARALRGEDEFPEGYRGSRTVADLNRLFDACFRIQREACQAAGRHIPMVVENVRGAEKWVGKAKWAYGSYLLWGDVPALMPPIKQNAKMPGCSYSSDREKGKTWGPHHAGACEAAGVKNPGFRFDGSGKSFQSESVNQHVKVPSAEGRRTDKGNGARFTSRDCGVEGRKQPGISGKRNNGKGDKWFQDGAARSGSKSSARKFASAQIAKIPLALSMHIARCYKPK